MVILHVKRGDKSIFLYETQLNTLVRDIIANIIVIYNGRLKVERICSEMESLALHGTMLPPNMIGLTDEQIEELKLVDEWGDRCIPSGGFIFNKDIYGRRNGKQPLTNMQELIKKTIADAKALIASKELIAKNECLTQKQIQQAISLLKGCCTIIYPMKLPPHDVIRMEFDNIEDLSGTHASLEVIEPQLAQLWFSGKEMDPDQKLSTYLGRNDKCKVIVKLQKKSEGAPSREAVISEESRKELMLLAYKKQEEWKKLEQNDDDDYLNSPWADNNQMKRSFQGIRGNISWKP
ncbi:cilia- and flagella-associated protein 298 [Chrysoperla carnea]|uniref:cilia- and flagella-associated protein 298 n=1 Tax=Chrysoperla carnea TaxID=189513 RepID=UPI001D077A09|nr:cilia- and flagella-associated protein 298 [Chrysoperla carnea]